MLFVVFECCYCAQAGCLAFTYLQLASCNKSVRQASRYQVMRSHCFFPVVSAFCNKVDLLQAVPT